MSELRTCTGRLFFLYLILLALTAVEPSVYYLKLVASILNYLIGGVRSYALYPQAYPLRIPVHNYPPSCVSTYLPSNNPYDQL